MGRVTKQKHLGIFFEEEIRQAETEDSGTSGVGPGSIAAVVVSTSAFVGIVTAIVSCTVARWRRFRARKVNEESPSSTPQAGSGNALVLVPRVGLGSQ